MQRFLRLLIILAMLCCWSWISAQPYSVTVTNSVTNFSPLLSDYSQPNQMVVTMISTDNRVFYYVALKVHISGNGYSLDTKDTYAGATFLLPKNTPVTITGSQLSNLFNPNNLNFTGLTYNDFLASGSQLPDGPVTICIEAYDVNYFTGLPVSNSGCASGMIQTAQPPVIISPLGEQNPSNAQNLLFAWQPMHVGSFPVDYTLEIYEDIDGLSPDFIVNNTPPYFSQSTSLTNYQYTPTDPLLDPTKTYLIRVKAMDVSGNTLFQNNGWSAIGSFYFEQVCGVPIDPYLISSTENSITIGWQPPAEGNVTGYQIRMIPVGSTDTTFISVDASVTSFKFAGLLPTETYLFEICTTCAGYGGWPCVQFGPVSTSNPDGSGCDPPANIAILATTNNTIQLSWSWPTDIDIDYPVIRWKPMGSSTFSNSVSVGAATTGYLLTNLTPGTTYDIEICYNCSEADQECGFINAATTTYNGSCTSPRNLTVSNLTHNGGQINWQAPNEATPPDNYIFHFKKSSVNNFTAFNISSTTYAMTNLTANTTYNIKVCIICNDGSQRCSFMDFTTAAPPDAGPCPPVDSLHASTIMTESVRMEWIRPGNVLWFEVSYKPSSEAGFTVLQNTYLTYHNIQNLSPETAYDVRVCYICSQTNTQICDTAQVSTAAPCEPVVGLNLDDIDDQTATISWDSVPGVAQYTLSYKTANASAFIQAGNTTQTVHTFTNLSAETTYDLQVCYDCPHENNTTLCDTLSVTTEPPKCDLAEATDLIYECGATPDYTLSTGIPLVHNVEEGDTLKAGDFYVILTDVSGTSPFFGDGYIEVPYLNQARLNVKFSNIEVDMQCRMVNGYMEVTGAGVDILSDEMENLLSDILSTIETIEDILNAAEAILSTIDEIIAAIEPYLPDEVITQLLEARYELAAAQQAYQIAQASGDQQAIEDAEAALEAARDQMQAANQAYVAAVAAFLEDFLNLVIAALAELYDEYASTSIESEYLTEKLNMDNWISNHNDQFGFGEAENPDNEVLDLDNALFYLSNSEQEALELDPANTQLFQIAESYYVKEYHYTKYMVVEQLKESVLSDGEVTQLGELFQIVGLNLLHSVGVLVNDESLTYDEKVDITKDIISQGLLNIFRKI